MATGAQTWSTAAASNNSADSSVNWAEGMAPSAVNNSARAEMASVAMWIKDNAGTLLTSGSTTAYTVTSVQGQTAVTDGYMIAVRFHAANDASATLNVDGVAAKAIELYAGQGLAGGEFQAGSVARFTYTSSSTSWILNNATALTTASFPTATIASSFTVTKATLLSSALTVSGTATITGAATLSSSLTVAKATLFSSGITAAAIAGAMVAVQSDQEAATSLVKAVAPGVQHYHPSAAKGWVYAGVVGNIVGTPYNVSSVSDTGTGAITINWATDFSSSDHSDVAIANDTNSMTVVRIDTIDAGTTLIRATDTANNTVDPDGYMVHAFGDQA